MTRNVAPSFLEEGAVAVSLSFDDGRPSQLDGAAILDEHGIKATFYVLPDQVERAPERWAGLVGRGHELGNHSTAHPCSGNFEFASSNALEDWTLQAIAADVDAATTSIEHLVGTRPLTFAYPCGQSFVGRGRQRQSYVPLIAERFVADVATAARPETCPTGVTSPTSTPTRSMVATPTPCWVSSAKAARAASG
jgi:peptidoglycan/xylan/chitin deacetylase (PgdA/CDA1 family)